MPHTLSMLARRSRSLIQWLFPLPYIWISTAIYSGVLIMYLVYHPLHGHKPDSGLLLAIMIVGLLILDRYEYHSYLDEPPKQVRWMFFAYRIVLIELAAMGLDLDYLSFLYAFLPFIAVMRLGWLVGLTSGFGIWLLFILKMSLGYPGWTLNVVHIDAVLTFHIMLGFTLLMARVVLREKDSRHQAELLLKELENSNRQLRHYADQIENLATLQERSRLARDIHDTIGHYLTAMSIQLEKAHVFFEIRPEAAQLSLQQSKVLADEALSEVRRSVGMLRSPANSFNLREALHQIVNRMQTDLLQVRLEIIGDLDDVSESLLMPLYRAAQEGLTNVQKHAFASHVVLCVSVTDENVAMMIEDDGSGFSVEALQERTQGYGLKGLQERLRLVGGTLDVISNPGQTQLKVAIPLGYA